MRSPTTRVENAVSADAEPPAEEPGQEPPPQRLRRRRLAGLRSRLLVAIPGIVAAIAVVVLGGHAWNEWSLDRALGLFGT